MDTYWTLARRSAWLHTRPTWGSSRQRTAWTFGILAVSVCTYPLARLVGLLPMTVEWAEVLRAGVYTLVMAFLLTVLLVGGLFIVNLILQRHFDLVQRRSDLIWKPSLQY